MHGELDRSCNRQESCFARSIAGLIPSTVYRPWIPARSYPQVETGVRHNRVGTIGFGPETNKH